MFILKKKEGKKTNPPPHPFLPLSPYTRYQAGRSKKAAKQAGLSRRKAELDRNLEIGAVCSSL